MNIRRTWRNQTHSWGLCVFDEYGNEGGSLTVFLQRGHLFGTYPQFIAPCQAQLWVKASRQCFCLHIVFSNIFSGQLQSHSSIFFMICTYLKRHIRILPVISDCAQLELPYIGWYTHLGCGFQMQPTCLVAEFEAPLDLLGFAASQTQASIAGPLLNVSGLVCGVPAAWFVDGSEWKIPLR